jgi:tRNA(Ile)-lysidine synthase TilS/MesJ
MRTVTIAEKYVEGLRKAYFDNNAKGAWKHFENVIGGNYQSLAKVYIKTKRFLKKMLSSRSRKGYVTWKAIERIKEKSPILRPYIKIPYTEFKKYVML